MKRSTIFSSLIAFVFVGLITASSAAQGIDSYTTIAYDEQTNTVTAYSQTVLDYDLVGEYKAQVHLTVRNSTGVICRIRPLDFPCERLC
jgi:hypothetical protein